MITKHYSEHILPDPWPFVIHVSRFHVYVLTSLKLYKHCVATKVTGLQQILFNPFKQQNVVTCEALLQNLISILFLLKSQHFYMQGVWGITFRRFWAKDGNQKVAVIVFSAFPTTRISWKALVLAFLSWCYGQKVDNPSQRRENWTFRLLSVAQKRLSLSSPLYMFYCYLTNCTFWCHSSNKHQHTRKLQWAGEEDCLQSCQTSEGHIHQNT